MGGILLVISTAVIIVVTALLFETIDNRLNIAQETIIRKMTVDELGRVKIHLKTTDISPDISVQVWGLDGELQTSFGTSDYFADKPFDEAALHLNQNVYREPRGPGWHIRVLREQRSKDSRVGHNPHHAQYGSDEVRPPLQASGAGSEYRLPGHCSRRQNRSPRLDRK